MEEEEEDQVYSWYVYILVVKNGYRISGCALLTHTSKEFPEYTEGAVPLRTYRGNRLSNIWQNFIYKPVKVIQQTILLRTPK
jgi:hypothetical protein